MNEDNNQLLGGLSPTEFLHTYWQKKPLLIRRAIPDLSLFISPDELFQFAFEETVESRIVLERGGDYPWQVLHGPFDESTLSRLSGSCWSLLVQGVNFHDARAACLLRKFSFIPNWRIDDLMISYAVDRGSVGPHVDSYDVFLLQTLGHRNWRISSKDYGDHEFLPDADLRIIEEFNYDQEWDLEPGDMLYLPPGTAHHGIALGECMTCSIGFRAPTHHELLSGYLEDRYNRDTDIQYADPDLVAQSQAGEISPDSLTRIKNIMRSLVENGEDIDSWFGRYITALPEAISPGDNPESVDLHGFREIIKRNPLMCLHHSSRAAFFQNGDELLLFVNGMEYRFRESCREIIHEITAYNTFDCSSLGPDVLDECTEVLQDLYNKGVLICR